MPHCLYFLLWDITSTAAHALDLLHLTAPPQLAPLSLGTDSCFPSPNPETSMGIVTCPPSKDIFNGQGLNLQDTYPPVLAIHQSPTMF